MLRNLVIQGTSASATENRPDARGRPTPWAHVLVRGSLVTTQRGRGAALLFTLFLAECDNYLTLLPACTLFPKLRKMPKN